ncbi:MAG: hypothetical protein OQL19_00625 [Gammaproteobacteria bacterium]|nr:hypothetical protein [Gammaproteobacteria bacterium]
MRKIFFLFLLHSLGILSLFYSSIALSQMKILSSEQKKYSIENKNINESSGLACSTRDKHLIWTHNDSGHMPIIYAMTHKGKDLATFHLDNINSYDWEDMDAFKYEGEHYLLIADTGDNLRIRWDYRISIIKEPKLDRKGASSISPAWSFSFKYEDGLSYDVESVAVDIVREKIILLTKRTSHAYIFELPLKPTLSGSSDDEQVQIAVKTGEFNQIVKPSALDVSADGQLLSINTYGRVHRFQRSSQNNGQQAGWEYVNSLKYKHLFQPEAMCLRMDEKYYYVSSEKKPKLLKLRAQ